MWDRHKNLACALMLTPLAARATTQASPPYIDTNVGEGDVSFITFSYQVIQFDLDGSRLALERSNNPKVRSVASYLIKTAGDYRGMISPAADRAGISYSAATGWTVSPTIRAARRAGPRWSSTM